MKKSNRKGFTIVELVIVIAVIAILAAVLIPTFSNLIKKANQSSDIQAARQMNTILAAEQGIGDNIDKVIDVLVANGYSANGLTPVTADHKFYYVVEYERIVLVDTKKNEVVFPADVELTDASVKYDLAGGVKYIDVVANDSAALQNAITAGSNKIDLTADVTFTTATPVQNGDIINIDLGTHTLTTGPRSNGGHHYAVRVNDGSVTIKNGDIVARGLELYGSSSLILENVNVTAADSNGGSCVWNEGSSVTITGGEFSATGDWVSDNNPSIIYNIGTVVINEGTFKSDSYTYAIKNVAGTTTINGGNFEAVRGVICAEAGEVTINGGTFAAEGANGGHVLYTEGTGKIVVNGGTFTGSLSGSVESIVINGGTFSANPTAYVNAETHTVTANADGTWTVTAK